MALMKPSTQVVSNAQATTETPDLVPFETDQPQAVQSAPWQDQPTFEQHTNVAAYVAPQAPAVQSRVSTNVANLEDAGFGGLSLGARSFPIISLKNDGVFEDTDGKGYGKEFRCRLINSKAKTAVQATKFTNGKTDEKVFFTYDGVSTTSGRSVVEVKAELAAEGRSFSTREYTDALVQMEAPGTEFDGELRILSISPMSRERLAGRIQALAIRKGWSTADLASNVGEFVLVVRCGDKVTSSKTPFYPWDFSFSSQ